MKMNKFLAGVCAGLIFCCQGMAIAGAPADVPKDVKYILGFYYGNGENILIRENDGNLVLCAKIIALPKPIFFLCRKSILILI